MSAPSPMAAAYLGDKNAEAFQRIQRVHGGMPRLRPGGPFEADPDDDSARVQFAQRLWHGQDALLRRRDRQVEENIRMLCGQHWMLYDEVAGRFRDITRYFTNEERRWRQLPVLNRLLLWFMLLHARMTENPPVVSFQPASGDQADAELAEIMDVVHKTVWEQAGMLEVIDTMVSWMIPGGVAYLKSRIDPSLGDFRPFVAPATLTLIDPETQSPILGVDGVPIQRRVEAAPYGPDGEVLAKLNPENPDEWQATGEPHMEREGALVVDVLSALEVRGEWGASTPWHRKSWHQHKSYLTPEAVWRTFGIEVEPEVRGQEASDAAEIQRLLLGEGFFGSASGRDEGMLGSTDAREGFVEVLETWYQPSEFPGMEATPEEPGGRLMVTTRMKCLRDGQRYAPFPHTSPIHQFDFVKVPGRQHGTSPQEMLNGPTRTRDRIVSHILQHGNLSTNPIMVYDRDAGIVAGQITNKPGQQVGANLAKTGGRPPIQYVSPPPLSTDVYRSLDILTREFDQLGNLEGAQGAPPTLNASGELVKELRFNSDRFVGPTQRRMVVGLARLVEDWPVMLPIIWDTEKVLKVAGDDAVAQTVTVLPEMFRSGSVNVVPDIESALPEGRGERQSRVWMMYNAQVFGPVGSPQANEKLMEYANFPHMSRVVRPYGPDGVTASQENGQLVQGAAAQEIGVAEWMDHAVHLLVHERLMKGPHFRKLPLPVQQEFVLHRLDHQNAMKALFQKGLAEQTAAAAAQAQASVIPQAAGMQAAGAAGLTPPPGKGPAKDAAPQSGKQPEGLP